MRVRENVMEQEKLVELTAVIVGAYVAHNPLPMAELPNFVAAVSSSLEQLGNHVITPTAQDLSPAVNPKRSVFPDYIISLEDGGHYKSLKRHLSTKYGLTPEEYRIKWGLPADYPMAAPNYTAMRSELAKANGLGRGNAGRPKKVPRRSRE